ncbi:MAG: dTDP-4-dehydrorhamnose 3,5-epimerase [Bacteroidetes bacterium]|nr:dTDP-4-dehydrorhamnose 3,5-epimerase [Bacteroidota bacterium]
MNLTPCSIPDLILIEPQVFEDSRGYFMETFSKQKFEDFIGRSLLFVQDNESMSNKGVVRGLHFQAPPHAQGKLVRVIKGSVLDVAVDIRTNSPTYGEYVAIELSAKNKRQLYIPEGFLHGFATLEDQTIFSYKCTDFYAPQSEGSVAWNDKDLNIDWLVDSPLVSAKDLEGTPFGLFKSPF